MDCAYCELPEIKARKIIENEYAFAFPTYIPIVPGHVLVCPTRCVAKLDDLLDHEIKAMRELIVALKPALTRIYGAEGFNFAWNEGKVAGQNVPHVHIHVLPRKEGDSGVHKYDPRKFLYRPGSREITPEEELVVIAKKIRDEMDGKQ